MSPGRAEERSEPGDRERWERRYAERPPRRKPAPAWLLEHLGLLPSRGRALDVAMGAGGAALALARHGLAVVGLDVAPTAARFAAQWAREEGLELEALASDVRDYAWPPRHFDVIAQLYFLDRAILPRLRAALRPGGFAVIETFSVRNRELDGPGPKREAWCLRPGELEEHFADFRIHAAREAVLEGPVAVQSIVASKASLA